MAESTEHPKRLWLVEEDASAGFAVREADVTPVFPETQPGDWRLYRVAGESELYTVMLGFDAFRTKVDALQRAVYMAADMVYEWEHKKDALADQLGAAEDEAAEADNEEEDE